MQVKVQNNGLWDCTITASKRKKLASKRPASKLVGTWGWLYIHNQGCVIIWQTTGPLVAENFLDWQKIFWIGRKNRG